LFFVLVLLLLLFILLQHIKLLPLRPRNRALDFRCRLLLPRLTSKK
jgi:hypothetical protein